MNIFLVSVAQADEEPEFLEPCEYELIGNTTVAFRVYSGLFAAFNFSVLFISLLAWVYHKDLPYLKKRNFSQVLFLSLAWMSNLLAGAVPRAASGSSSFINYCVFLTVTFALFAPCILFPQTIRVILVYNRVRLNQTISELFQERKVSNEERFRSQIAKKIEMVENNGEVRRLKFMASQRFGDLLSLLGLILSGVMAFALAYFNCPSLGSDTCKIASIADVKETLIFALPGIFCFFFVVFIQVKIGGYPDPFCILSEIRNGFLIGILFLVPSLIFSITDVGDFEKQVPQGFSFSFLFDIGVSVYFIYTIPYQIYLARKFDLKQVIIVNGFEDLLRNDIGRSLFRQHLVNEFSVENLNLYEAGLAYKQMFDDDTVDGDIRRKVAENMYSRYLKPLEQGSVNLPPHLVAEVQERLNTTVAVYEDLFDRVLDEVYRLMKYDSFSRFQRTEAYRDYMGTVEIDEYSDTSRSLQI